MTGGTLIYKCRLCGELDKSTHAPNGNTALISTVLDMPFPVDWGPITPKMVGIHGCGNGRVGVTDLVGVEFDKEIEREGE